MTTLSIECGWQEIFKAIVLSVILFRWLWLEMRSIFTAMLEGR